MPECEAFDFHKLKKNCYFGPLSKMVRISAFCWNELFSYFFIFFHFLIFQPFICNLMITLISKRDP